MPIYGYVRVSTNGQTLDVQLAALTAAGCTKVFCEKVGGAISDRRQLKRVLNRLVSKDMVLVTRLDRFARSTRDLLNIIAAIYSKGASFRSLGDAWADITTAHGRLLLTVLASLTEFERELILTRTGEGRAQARTRGVKFGQDPS
jgi:DNA invertase Pin-like site-specific DNA recombinase